MCVYIHAAINVYTTVYTHGSQGATHIYIYVSMHKSTRTVYALSIFMPMHMSIRMALHISIHMLPLARLLRTSQVRLALLCTHARTHACMHARL